MWLFLNDSALSIVAHKENPRVLVVRARVAGDIERVFPRAKVAETPRNDYRYRAEVRRETVAKAIGRRLEAIEYPNFKASVHDWVRHDAYFRIWDDWLSGSFSVDKPRGVGRANGKRFAPRHAVSRLEAARS